MAILKKYKISPKTLTNPGTCEKVAEKSALGHCFQHPFHRSDKAVIESGWYAKEEFLPPHPKRRNKFMETISCVPCW